jgi:2-polyprenyl-3-methyl-5-hydroxy-6-metoxy-1,4-benzoquinol methylase
VRENGLRYQSKEGDPHSSHSVILRLAGEGQGKRLLDVGSAQGVLARRFREHGFDVTCIEGDPKLAELGRAFSNRMIVADLDQEFPSLNDQFDVIVYGDILEHLKRPEVLLTNLNKHLTPSGFVIASAPNFAHLFVRLNILLGRFEYMERGILDQTHLRFFTQKSFRKLLEQAGLKVERLLATPVPLPLIVPLRYQVGWLRVAHSMNALLARGWKNMFGYQFVVVARPRAGAQA